MGAYAAAVKAKEQKMARFIGITCHAYPDVLATALDRHKFDCTQMALNAALRGQVKGAEGSFETTALPVALRKKMGVTAMKIFAQDALVGQAAPEKLIHYSMSLPVAATVIGMPKVEHIEHNVAAAKAFHPLPADEIYSSKQRARDINEAESTALAEIRGLVARNIRATPEQGRFSLSPLGEYFSWNGETANDEPVKLVDAAWRNDRWELTFDSRWRAKAIVEMVDGKSKVTSSTRIETK